MNPDLSGGDLWEQALKRVSGARVTIVIGAADTGKTRLVTSLADALIASGHTCGIVDADIGQSDIGPPTTIGLGRVFKSHEDITCIDEKGIYFVGAPSPKGHLLPTVVGTKVMVDKALELGFDHVLIDTTGLVQGYLGEALKGHKVELVKPDLLIVLQRQAECEHLIRRFRAIPTRDTIVLTPSENVKKKSPAERKAFRERALLSYFFNSTTSTLNLENRSLMGAPLFWGYPLSEQERADLSKEINMDVLWGESLDDELRLVTRGSVRDEDLKSLARDSGKNALFAFTLDEFANILVGLYDEKGDCYSLGIVKRIDFSNRHVDVEVAQDRSEPCGIKFSRFKMNHDGSGALLPPKRPIRQGSFA
jgi:polynucleotide 5'-hydroxyl-kinase GRC3/NOL9